MDRDWQTATLNYEILTVWEWHLKSRLDCRWNQNRSQGLKPRKLWDDGDDEDLQFFAVVLYWLLMQRTALCTKRQTSSKARNISCLAEPEHIMIIFEV